MTKRDSEEEEMAGNQYYLNRKVDDMPNREPNFERFLKAVRREGEPDRVPFAELFHDGEIMSEIQGPPRPGENAAAWRVRFWRELGYDYVTQSLNFGFPTRQISAADTASLSRGERSWVSEGAGTITNWEEFERYPWPKISDETFRPLEEMAKELPEGMKIAAMLPGGPFENITFLMGFEVFSYSLVDQPELVEAIAGRVNDTLIEIVEHTSAIEEVGAQWLNDDLGFKGGTLASPAFLREWIFPALKRICTISHGRGKPTLLHSCGKLDEVMDELIDEVGIDAKHSFEHVISPVWEVKRKWGSRVALLGGVDMDVLARGTEEEVRKYTRRCIEECAPGGGYAVGSGNSVANYLPVRNFLAMLEEADSIG